MTTQKGSESLRTKAPTAEKPWSAHCASVGKWLGLPPTCPRSTQSLRPQCSGRSEWTLSKGHLVEKPARVDPGGPGRARERMLPEAFGGEVIRILSAQLGFHVTRNVDTSKFLPRNKKTHTLLFYPSFDLVTDKGTREPVAAQGSGPVPSADCGVRRCRFHGGAWLRRGKLRNA